MENKLYLRCFWNWLYLKSSSNFPKQFKSHEEYYQVYLDKMSSEPQIAKLDLHTMEFSIYPTNFSRTYIEKDTSLYVKEVVKLVCAKDELIFHPSNSNQILMLNPQTMKVQRRISIQSQYSDIGMPARSARESYLEAYYTQEDAKIGRIQNILYNDKNKLYYAVVTHVLPEEDADTNISSNIYLMEDRDFSIIIYDNNLRKINEQFFAKEEYNYKYIFICSRGLLIAVSENTRDYDPTKCKFVLYEIEK